MAWLGEGGKGEIGDVLEAACACELVQVWHFDCHNSPYPDVPRCPVIGQPQREDEQMSELGPYAPNSASECLEGSYANNNLGKFWADK